MGVVASASLIAGITPAMQWYIHGDLSQNVGRAYTNSDICSQMCDFAAAN
jgi:hypothetical protein